MSEFAGNRNAPGPLTLADFEALPEDDNYRTELSRGWLMREPRPGGEHGCVSGNLYYVLRSFVSAHGLGRVLSRPVSASRRILRPCAVPTSRS